MIRSFYAFVCASIVLMCLNLGVSAAELTPDFIQGNWAINTDGKCGLADAEYLSIRKNGTFDNSRGKVAEGVGFWRLEGDLVVFEVLTSPAFFHDLHQELKPFEDMYGHYTIRAVLFNNKADQFEAVAALGEQIKKFSAVRCK